MHAPRELVWEGWTRPEHIARWWGPKGWRTTVYEMDVRPGGIWIIAGENPPDPSTGTPSYDSFEPGRYAMGDTLRYAQRMNLIGMEPRGDLSSTGFALANPGEEYLFSSRVTRLVRSQQH